MAQSPQTPPTSNSDVPERHIVIIGAGIIGCATAYYLSRDRSLDSKHTVHLVESSPELFASASGKSGGFLAADWFDRASSSLGELSFRLHQELAEEYDGFGKWGYSRSTHSPSIVAEPAALHTRLQHQGGMLIQFYPGTGTSFTEGPENRSKKGLEEGGEQTGDWLASGGSRAEQASAAAVHEFRSQEEDGGPTWLNRRRGDQVEILGEEGSVAQVDPLRLSQFLLQRSLEAGVVLHQPAKPVSLAESSLTIETEQETQTLPCTHLLIASGAWTPRVFSTLFPEARCRILISPYAGHSLVLRSPRWTKQHEKAGCHAIFATARKGFSPEIFSRIGEEVYIAGLNSSSIALPNVATDAVIDESSIRELKKVAARYLGEQEGDVEILREGLCFRPVTPKGAPVLARVPDQQLGVEEPGACPSIFIAAGHGPWGIALSLGTGKVMAEMLCGTPTKQLSADIRGLGMQ